MLGLVVLVKHHQVKMEAAATLAILLILLL
jgi:hypothetical protein